MPKELMQILSPPHRVASSGRHRVHLGSVNHTLSTENHVYLRPDTLLHIYTHAYKKDAPGCEQRILLHSDTEDSSISRDAGHLKSIFSYYFRIAQDRDLPSFFCVSFIQKKTQQSPIDVIS